MNRRKLTTDLHAAMDRLDSLEAENAELRAEVARLSASVGFWQVFAAETKRELVLLVELLHRRKAGASSSRQIETMTPQETTA